MRVINPKVNSSILNAAVVLLQPAFPELNTVNLVDALTNHKVTTIHPETFLKRGLTIAETAKVLHVSLPTIFRMMKEGTLPYCRVNKRRILIPVDAINEMLTVSSKMQTEDSK